MRAAIALGERGVGQTGPNPAVGCLVVRGDIIVGRGWTQPGGRPHAEAVALAQAGAKAEGSVIYVTLEPCAHKSSRGAACVDLVLAAKPARVVIASVDPDPRTASKAVARLKAAGIAVTIGCLERQAQQAMGGFFSRMLLRRPQVTLKLATSLDGKIALKDGSSRWITGDAARAHVHLERARHDAILVGGSTLRRDDPALDVRLDGLEHRSPKPFVLSGKEAPDGWGQLSAPEQIGKLEVNRLMVEGGAETASAFLEAGLVDRLLLYRAPILIGSGKACLGDIGLNRLGDAHGRWKQADSRMLGPDRMELYLKNEAA